MRFDDMFPLKMVVVIAALAIGLGGCTLGSGYILSPTDKCYHIYMAEGGKVQIHGGPVMMEMEGPMTYESKGKDCAKASE